jgi:ArsR family transcriptional regulator
MKSSLFHEIAHMQAELCASFTDPTRILILYALNQHPRNVGELAEEVAIPHSTASRHLKVLREHGLVTAFRRGTVVEYQLADPRLLEALDLLRTIMRDLIANRASLSETITD